MTQSSTSGKRGGDGSTRSGMLIDARTGVGDVSADGSTRSLVRGGPLLVVLSMAELTSRFESLQHEFDRCGALDG